jgi:hypothetical protein
MNNPMVQPLSEKLIAIYLINKFRGSHKTQMCIIISTNVRPWTLF